MRFRKSAHAIYKTEYHLFWIPRYRRKIFAKGVREYTEKILSHIPELYPDIEVVKLSVQEDHVHMVVVIPLKNCSCRCNSVYQNTVGKKTQGEISFYAKNLCKERRHLVERILCIVYRLE